MPELPEVEVIARGLNATLRGREIQRVEPVEPTRLSDPAGQVMELVQGRTVARVSRRAKVLLVHLDSGSVMAAHLKMTGRLVHGPDMDDIRYDRWRFHLDDGSTLRYADVRRFGYVRVFAPGQLDAWPFYAQLGPEPLETSAEVLADRVAGRAGRIKGLLLDQRVVAGVGNIYADESLFRAGIRPTTKARRVSRPRLVRLFEHLQAVLRQAIAENGSSIRDYRDSGGNAGAFQNSFQVYGKAGQKCPQCSDIMVKTTVSGRTSTYCPTCQS